MKNIDDLLNAVKEKSDWNSDYKIAKNLGTVSQHVNNWRRRAQMPSNKHVIEMCRVAGIDIGEAILAVEYSREFERPLKEAGFADVYAMTGLTSLSLAAVAAANHSPALMALAAGFGGAIYIMRHKRMIAAPMQNA